MTAPIDLAAIADEFLQQCGLHDAGISATCACAERDYRPTMLALVAEVERLRSALEVVNRHARTSDATIHHLSQANDELRRQLALPPALARTTYPPVTDGAS